MTAGVRLLALRKQNGLSQEELAERLGVTRQAVSKWERGEALPDTENLITLARLYRVSLDELLLGDAAEKHNGEDSDSEYSGSEYSEAEYTQVDFKADAEALYAQPHDESADRLVRANFSAEADGRGATISANTDVAPRDKSYYEFNIAGMHFRLSHAQFPYPVFVTIFYLFLGFVFSWWHPSWILFLTIPLYYTVPDLSGKDNREKARELLKFPYPVVCAIAYLMIGFLWNWWHPTWLLFLTIPLYYIFLASVEKS
ncbi:MAG: helix-turn-helix domain-containing protein [Oscillospiraceae bacterium]|jgi:transcriptional regulator with XRE-family HTH domain|nr:helix-turn-helix domain-containing protein [Oscillospiraceae bacterium]